MLKKSAFLFCVICCMCMCTPFWAEGEAELSADKARALYSLLENLKEQRSLFCEEVSAKTLCALLNEHYAADVKLYEADNDFVLSGTVDVRVDASNKMLDFYTFYLAKNALSDAQALRLANSWNKEKIFLNASWDGERFLLHYFMTYDGGIHADNLNATLDWYFDLCSDFVRYCEKL